MVRSRILAVGFATLALATAAGARAESEPLHLTLASSDFSTSIPSPSAVSPRRSVDFGETGRWGLKLGVEQHFDRDVQWRDVEPGVYYRLTPRLHIGGGVNFGRDQIENLRLTTPQMPAPRVRLETTLKF